MPFWYINDIKSKALQVPNLCLNQENKTEPAARNLQERRGNFWMEIVIIIISKLSNAPPVRNTNDGRTLAINCQHHPVGIWKGL